MITEAATRLEEAFSNLIPCNQHEFPFVDRYAQFAVVFEEGRPMGPGELQVRSCVTFQAVCGPLLSLWLEDGPEWVPVPRTNLQSLPWRVTEKGRVTVDQAVVEVTGTHIFLDERRMASRFQFSHAVGESAVTLNPHWRGQFTPDSYSDRIWKEYACFEPQPRRIVATAGEEGVTGGLRNAGDVFLPEPAVAIRCLADSGFTVRLGRDPVGGMATAEVRLPVEAGVGESVFYSLSAGPIRLVPGETREVVMVTELAVATWRDPQHRWLSDAHRSIDFEAAIQSSRDDFERRIAPAERLPVSTLRRPRLRRADWALLRTGYRASGPAGELGDGLASTCVPVGGSFTHIFFWDSLFTAVALADFEPALARGAITSVFCRQLEDGHCPEHVFNYWIERRHTIGAPQAPIASWAVSQYLERYPEDMDFLRSVLPWLKRNHEYWLRKGDRDRDGLAEWTWSGQTADTSPLYDEFKASRSGCVHLPPVASVSLNAFLYRDALLLADLCERVGEKGGQTDYRESAEQRQQAFFRWCYVPGERRFWDYNHATGRHRKVRTFYLFWPIWAGMAVPEETRRELIEDVLLDQRQFFGPIPFPSVAYDESSHYNGSRNDPDGRAWWRGRAWPHISYWLIEMLAREGYGDAAEEAARRFLMAHDRESNFPEHMSVDPGAYRVNNSRFGGFEDYNWGQAAYHLVATGAYRSAPGWASDRPA